MAVVSATSPIDSSSLLIMFPAAVAKSPVFDISVCNCTALIPRLSITRTDLRPIPVMILSTR